MARQRNNATTISTITARIAKDDPNRLITTLRFDVHLNNRDSRELVGLLESDRFRERLDEPMRILGEMYREAANSIGAKPFAVRREYNRRQLDSDRRTLFYHNILLVTLNTYIYSFRKIFI